MRTRRVRAMLFEQDVTYESVSEQIVTAGEHSRLMSFDIDFHDAGAPDSNGIQAGKGNGNSSIRFETRKPGVFAVAGWKTKMALTVSIGKSNRANLDRRNP